MKMLGQAIAECFGTGLLVLFLEIASPISRAQSTFVVPSFLANTEGDAGGQLGLPQEAISPAAFPVLPNPGVVLTDMNYRLDLGTVGRQRTLDSFEIALSTNPRGAQDDVSLFTPGPDRTVVFFGTKTFDLPDPQPPGPTPFNITFHFSTPFYYPVGATLLVETTGRSSPTWPGLDATFSPLLTQAFNSSTGPVVGPGGYVIQFGYVIPEPDATHIFLVCALFLGTHGVWRKR